jgi:hypothetical protein
VSIRASNESMEPRKGSHVCAGTETIHSV